MRNVKDGFILDFKVICEDVSLNVFGFQVTNMVTNIPLILHTKVKSVDHLYFAKKVSEFQNENERAGKFKAVVYTVCPIYMKKLSFEPTCRDFRA